MTLRTGLIITGDTEGAQKALTDLQGGMGRTAAAAEGLAGAERVVEAATEGLEAELRQALATIGALETQLAGARDMIGQLAGRVDVLETQLNRAAVAGRGNVRSMGEQALGARMLGQQFQDMGIMAGMGVKSAADVLRILSMQAGQTALAIEQMGVKGAIGRTAAFLGSPWGSIMLAATLVLAPFVAKLFETAEAAKAAELASSGLGEAENDLAALFGKTSSKIAEQNELLLINARIKAANLRLDAAQDAKDAAKVFQRAGQNNYVPGTELLGLLGVGGGNAAVQKIAERARLATNAQRLTGETDAHFAEVQGKILDQIIKDAQKTDFKGSGYSQSEFLEGISKFAASRANTRIADLLDKSLDSRKIVAELQKPGGRTRRQPSTAARDEFGRDAADKITSIVESFSDIPGPVQQADRAIRQLDDIIDDLSRKKPPNFEGLIANAEAAKRTVETGLLRSIGEAFEKPDVLADKAAKAFGILDDLADAASAKLQAGLVSKEWFERFRAEIANTRQVINDGLDRPFREFLQSQEEAVAVQNLIAEGREAEAEALRVIIQLEKDRAPLTAKQKDEILASVQALRAAQRETDALRDRQQVYLDALSSMEGIVRDANQAFVRGDLGQFIKAPKKLLDAFMSFQADKLFERIFGDLFRQLEDEVRGTSVVEDASARMAGAVDQVSLSLRDLGAAASSASNAMRGQGWLDGVPADPLGLGDLFGAANDNEIKVTGRRDTPLGAAGPFFERALGGVVEKFASIFTSPESAKALGKNIGTWAGKGLEGAATGTFVSGISNALGIKMSSGGAQIGGAAAGLLGQIKGLGFLGGPVGTVLSSVLGGLLGGLFKKVDYGTALVSSANGDPRVSGTSKDMRSGAGSLAEQVQAGVKQIADRLGGALGSFDLAIGTFDGKYRVRTTTSGWDQKGPLDYKGKSGNNLVDFGDDQAGAIAFAIMDAVKDGAVTGLSAAVQKALRSSPDLDAALEEALKVGDLEQLLGGVTGAFEKAFRDLDKEAADRLRIAREYGFDVVKVEEINAKKRLELTNQLLDQQVGSLQRLIDEMTAGSLFEGSSVDQRTALLAQIETARSDLDKGVEGAADKLAGLYEQLNSVSKEVYGTTGGFATDRSAILDQARAAIAKANEQIRAAQGETSDPALATTNAALDENNDQNARIIDALERSNDLLEAIGRGFDNDRDGILDLVRLAKTG